MAQPLNLLCLTLSAANVPVLVLVNIDRQLVHVLLPAVLPQASLELLLLEQSCIELRLNQATGFGVSVN